jgi:hypothetical protein
MRAKFFSIDFLENLPSDELDALDVLCKEFANFDRFDQAQKSPQTLYHDDFIAGVCR